MPPGYLSAGKCRWITNRLNEGENPRTDHSL